jgi:hypothetical protein
LGKVVDIVTDNGVPADLKAAWEAVVASDLLCGVLARTWRTFDVGRKLSKLSAVSEETPRNELLAHIEGAISEKLGKVLVVPCQPRHSLVVI